MPREVAAIDTVSTEYSRPNILQDGFPTWVMSKLKLMCLSAYQAFQPQRKLKQDEE